MPFPSSHMKSSRSKRAAVAGGSEQSDFEAGERPVEARCVLEGEGDLKERVA